MRFPLRIAAFALLTGGLLTAVPTGMHAQATKDQEKEKEKDPEKKAEKNQKYEDISFLTPDGLRLFGAWYKGNKGRNSDAIMMLPNYKSEYSKGEWGTLAEELQKEGFSVLVFDWRGHGKSKSVKTIDDPRRYIDTFSYPWNKFANVNSKMNPASIKGVDVTRFNPAIFPYLVNDIAGARKFLDTRNDAGECNVGRMSIVADGDACGLAMAWMGTEFRRIAVYAKNTFDVAPNYFGSKDLLAGVWLSYKPGLGANRTVINTAQADSTTYSVFKDKITMAFVYGDSDTTSQTAANEWYRKWGISGKDDPKTGKYMVEVKNGKSLTGINLCDPSKNLDTIKMVVEILKGAQKRQLSGNDWQTRNVTGDPPMKISLDQFGVKDPQ